LKLSYVTPDIAVYVEFLRARALTVDFEHDGRIILISVQYFAYGQTIESV